MTGIYTAIVTFSPQVKMIFQVLQKVFPTIVDQVRKGFHDMSQIIVEVS